MSSSTDSKNEETKETSYQGNCHCKAVKFTVTLPRPLESSPSQITKCNCSICGRNGYLLVHGPASTLNLGDINEDDKVSTYAFGNKQGLHKFCKTCGSSLFIRAPEANFAGVNIRMLKGVDFESLETNAYDGWNKGMSGPYEE